MILSREHFELFLKTNDFTFDGEWFIPKVPTSMAPPLDADIYVTKCEEKGALLKYLLKHHIYYPLYLDDSFFIWPYGKTAFSHILIALYKHEAPINFNILSDLI